MKNEDKESLRKALDAAILALDDWTNTYASVPEGWMPLPTPPKVWYEPI